jgi:hypothetical protein
MAGGVGALDERSPFQRGTTALSRLTAVKQRMAKVAGMHHMEACGGVFYCDCLKLDLATAKSQDAVLCV